LRGRGGGTHDRRPGEGGAPSSLLLLLSKRAEGKERAHRRRQAVASSTADLRGKRKGEAGVERREEVETSAAGARH